MSLLALEAWNHRSGLAEPLSRLRQSDALNHDINLRHGVQKGAAFMVLAANASLRHRAFDPREVWERTDAYTSQGVPVLLILKGVKDGENVGHAVVAYRCTRERNHGSDEQWILIADPNVRSAPGQKDKQSYIGIRADGSYYVMRPDGPYFEYEGPPHISGVRGERFLMEAPSSVLAGPHYTPTMAIELGCSWLKLVIASHSSGPIRQVGTTSGLVWFGDRRRAVLQGIKDNRATLVAAAAVLGTAAEEPERDQDPTRVTRSQGALEMIAALTGASLGGPPAPVREVLSAIARVPSDLAQGARDSWSGLGPAVLTTELTDDAVNSIITNLGNYVTVDAWPRMVEVPIDDTAPGSHQLFALQGPVPADLFVQYSAAQSYDLTATASGCAVRVTSILQRAGFDGLDTVKLDRLASARPGVRVSTSAGLGRGVSVALTRHLAGDDRAHVGWKLDLDLATEESELSWAVGRVGAVLTPGSDTPERIIQFAGGPPDNTSQSSYWVPPATASERLQMYPADLASPFGVLRIDRVARLDGRLLDRTEIDPSR